MTKGRVALALSLVGILVFLGRERLLSPLESLRRPPSPPNVVLIILDSLRADLLGCYGYPGPTSPEIDAMARSGALFENVLSQSSWTRPSIASMLTSRYPRSLGIYQERFDALKPEELTLAEMLKERGYATLGFTANPNINASFHFDQGFDEYLGSSVRFQWMGRRRAVGEDRGEERAQLPKADGVYERVLEVAGALPPQPVYVQIDVMEVHSPKLRREEYTRLFEDLPVAEPADHDSTQRNEFLRLVRGTPAALRQLSRDTGRFIESLSELPGWRNTLFIITSDHGQGLDDHPSVGKSARHGNLLYESQTRVPLILYNPADPELGAGGSPIEERVRLLDLMPTTLEYVGIPPPPQAEGRSVLSLARGRGDPPSLPEVFVTETQWRTVDKVAVYSDEWKYIENRDSWPGVNEFELQRIAVTEDGARTDRIDQYGEVAESLQEVLLRWEERFPREPSLQSHEDPSPGDLEQLRSLGYLQ